MRLAILLILALGGAAAAKGWPTPAAGESASGDPEILFTFDDGPSPTTTPKVLDTLAKYKVHAVFFMVGEMVEGGNKRTTALVQRILREGHVIANHTMKHKDLCRVKSDEAAAGDIDLGREAIEKISGQKLGWFRTPFGARCKRVEEMLAERGLVHFHWDLDPQEWKHKDAKMAFDYVTGNLARTSDRNVLLMHDIQPATVGALPEILAWIAAENGRRAEAKKRPIRIVQAPMYAAETLPKGFAAWASDAKARVTGLRGAIASVLP